jgi:hypothetical protein
VAAREHLSTGRGGSVGSSGVGAILDARSQFGELALRVSSGANAAVRVKDVAIVDLTQRVAGLARNAGDSRLRQVTDLFYAEGIAQET